MTPDRPWTRFHRSAHDTRVRVHDRAAANHLLGPGHGLRHGYGRGKTMARLRFARQGVDPTKKSAPGCAFDALPLGRTFMPQLKRCPHRLLHRSSTHAKTASSVRVASQAGPFICVKQAMQFESPAQSLCSWQQ